MFLDEARIAATLDHPNIVQIYDVGQSTASYFIAMEYLHGEDLQRDRARGAASAATPSSPLEHALGIVLGVLRRPALRAREARHRRPAARHRPPRRHAAEHRRHLRRRRQGRRLRHRQGGDARRARRRPARSRARSAYMSPEQCARRARRPAQRHLRPRHRALRADDGQAALSRAPRLRHAEEDHRRAGAVARADILPFYPALLNTIVARCLQKNRRRPLSDARAICTPSSTPSRATTSWSPAPCRSRSTWSASSPTSWRRRRDGRRRAVDARETRGAAADRRASYLGESSRRSSRSRRR